MRNMNREALPSRCSPYWLGKKIFIALIFLSIWDFFPFLKNAFFQFFFFVWYFDSNLILFCLSIWLKRSVVLVYNLPGISSLTLSRTAIADIFLGKVVYWNASSIASLTLCQMKRSYWLSERMWAAPPKCSPPKYSPLL